MSGKYKVISEFIDKATGRRMYPGAVFNPSPEQAKRLVKAGCLIFAGENKKKDLPEKVRIHEITKSLGLDSNEPVIETAADLGYEVTSHASSVTGEQAEKIKEKLSK